MSENGLGLSRPSTNDARWKIRAKPVGLCELRRCSPERLDQRLRREWLCEIGEASGLKGSGANGRAVVPSQVDDRHGNASSVEAMPQLDPLPIAQVDVEKDANRPVEIGLVCESLGRRKQQAGVAELPQHSSYTPQHSGVVIDDKDEVSIWQE
jgi:hypothetical protein